MGSPSGGVGGSASSGQSGSAGSAGSGGSSSGAASGSGSSGASSGSDFSSSVSQADSSRNSGGDRSDSSGSAGNGNGSTTSTSSGPTSDAGLTAAQSEALADGAGVIDGYAFSPEPTPDDETADDNQANAAVVGRSAAQSRNEYVGAQTRQVTDRVNNAPMTPYDGDVYRSVDTPYASTYNDAQYSSPGRYNRVGESTLYTSESMHGIEVEAGRYPSATDPTGLAGKTVTRSELNGNVIDATTLPNVTDGALTEGYGQQGRERSTLSVVTGEDPYTNTRALNDAARARGAEGVRVPAGEGAVHVGVMPGNMTDPASQLQYRDHVTFDANGVPGPVQTTPGSISPPPPANTPNIHDPASPMHNPDRTAQVRVDDAAAHSRAGSVRYGATGGALVSGVQALSDGELTAEDARDVAIGTGTGAAAAYADDVLSPRIGGLRAGGVIDGAISAGTSLYSNAGAYERGEISAADATADVVVDTGVGVASGLAGAAAGAAIGSVVPVAGTAVGAVIGFGVGMLASWGTSAALEQTGAADWAREGLGDVLEDNVGDGVLEGAWDKISSWF
ncbi:MAG: hypothetical protein R3F54_12690 [Alphaproteobacteria bacterium]